MLLIAAGTQTWAATFYDVLKADPQHKLIMKAVDADPAGTMKKMLQDTAPVTAFVPVDKVGTQQQLVLLLQTITSSGGSIRDAAVLLSRLPQCMYQAARSVYNTSLQHLEQIQHLETSVPAASMCMTM